MMSRFLIIAGLLCSVAAAERPNIVVFLADDMHSHHPGFNGGLAHTPHLDQLAREGTRLTQFYVHSVCSPTRASFLTGRYPFRTGMEERSHGNDVAGMLTDERTLANALQEAGYYTAIIGKWHLGNWHKRHLPLQRGFDYQYGLYGALISYYDKARERFYDWHRNEQTLREEGYSTDLIAREAVSVIDHYDRSNPFFLYIPFNAVHGPDEAPPEPLRDYRTLAEKRSEDPSNLDYLKFPVVESMDAAIGRILEALERKGVLDETLVVFFNDNGGRVANPPLRGGKGETYEGGVRVPCLWRWPGKIPANRSVDGMMHVVDLYPTLVRVAGGSLKQPLPLDGMDMWKVVAKGKPSPRVEVVHSLPYELGDTGVMSIRRGSYKLHGDALYDLEKDPAEQKDIAKERPEVYQSLRQRIQELGDQRRRPEEHNKITDTIDQPLLVFGKEENATPPRWLAPYLKALPPTKNERKAEERKSGR